MNLIFIKHTSNALRQKKLCSEILCVVRRSHLSSQSGGTSTTTLCLRGQQPTHTLKRGDARVPSTVPFILLRRDSIVCRQQTDCGLSRISFSLESQTLRSRDWNQISILFQPNNKNTYHKPKLALFSSAHTWVSDSICGARNKLWVVTPCDRRSRHAACLPKNFFIGDPYSPATISSV